MGRQGERQGGTEIETGEGETEIEIETGRGDREKTDSEIGREVGDMERDRDKERWGERQIETE